MLDYRELLRRARGGDRAAFSEIVARFRDMARACALKRLRNASLAEDAVQDAFLTAYLKLDALKNADAFPSWLRAIVRSRCGDLEKRSAPPEAVLAALAPQAPTDPLEIVTRRLEREEVGRLLESLSGVERQACLLRFCEGRSYREIGEALGIPLGTVKRRLHQARLRILKRLDRGGRPGLTVGFLPVTDHLLAMAAHELRNGERFELRLRKFLSWRALAQALLDDRLDAAFVMAPLAMDLRNRGARIVHVLDAHHDGSAVTLRASLAGRLPPKARLALPHPLSTHRALLRLVAPSRRGRSGDRPREIFLSPSYAPRLLAKGDIDGFFCAEPWGAAAEARGIGRALVLSRDLAPGHVCCLAVARQRLVEARPELLADYLRLLKTAAAFIRKRPAAAAAIQARRTGVDQGLAEGVLRGRRVTFEDLEPDRERTEAAMRLALAAGILDAPCDLEAFSLGI